MKDMKAVFLIESILLQVRGVFRNADDAEKRAWLYKLKNSEGK